MLLSAAALSSWPVYICLASLVMFIKYHVAFQALSRFMVRYLFDERARVAPALRTGNGKVF